MTKLKADKLTSTSRLDEPMDKVVADILDVATREFASLGLAGARIEKIQEQTQTSKRMIYYHFGSKEGLYKAVIESAFLQARKVDQGFNPLSGSPEEALKKIVSNAFEAFSKNPNFVRLLTFENLAGAPYIRNSEHASRLNKLAMDDLEVVLNRGQLDGSFRKDIKPLDVYINLVGLCFYHVAHHAAYLATGFQDNGNSITKSKSFHAQRKRAIQDTCWRYVKSP